MSALPPLVPGRADPAQDAADCDCCAGVAPVTPGAIFNRPALSAVAYRPGDYAGFLASQLARLSSEEYPALRQLRARDDDYSIALIDAWSCVCEVLSFYQERHAHEAWLGTARERESILELGRLIGYRPRPGVAAATDLVFLLDEPPGAPPPAPITIPARTRVQSVPGDGETAQTFETVEAIEARAQWNALVPRRSYPLPPSNGQTQTWLKGVATGLKAGDIILVLGAARAGGDTTSTQWDLRRLTQVTAEADQDRTRIEWTPPLDSVNPAAGGAPGHHLFALRARASLFGWNAPHPILLSDQARTRYGFTDNSDWSFTLDTANGVIHLDAIHDRFVAGSWVALTAAPGITALYRITAAVDDGRADYAVSARVTRLSLDNAAGLGDFDAEAYRKTSVYGASEELELAPTPSSVPILLNFVDLAGRVDGLTKGRRVMVSGRRAQAQATRDGLLLVPDDGAAPSLPIARGARLTLLGLPRVEPPGSANVLWPLRSPGGVDGIVATTLQDIPLVFVDADDGAEQVSEAAVLKEAALADETHQLLRFEQSLAHIYDRASTRIHANVAPATHGETTQEVLGSGDAGQPFGAFRLKQTPLTHVSAATGGGAQSTLEVRVNDILWHEVPSLYGQPAGAAVYETRINDDGSAVVQFGDGVNGARPPTGRNNLVATYRKGIGRAGSVAARTLTTAIDRPLGLKDVLNPLRAAGGQDAETLDSARDNAPVGTLTLGRVVSLRNYEDYARAFAGIAKARADTLWDGESRRIVVSVAGPGGEAVEPGTGDVHANLLDAMRRYGDPFVRISLLTYRPAFFRLKARLLLHPDHLPDKVLAAVTQALHAAYGFEARGFTALVAASEVIAVMSAVAGVQAVDLDRLHRTSGAGSSPILHQRLLAESARLAADGSPQSAEILTLQAGGAELEVMT